MKSILNIEKSLYQIRTYLLNDEVIRRLLYLQVPSALTATAAVTTAMAENLITLIPYIEDTNGVAQSAETNFIVIYPKSVMFDQTNRNDIMLGIDIFVDKTYYLLDSNKLRLTQLLHRVIELLNEKKLSFAEKLKITNASLLSIEDGKTIGFSSLWEVVDGVATTDY